MNQISSLSLTVALALGAAAFAGAGPDGKSTPEGPDGAKLWSQNCSRCHNVRKPETYSGQQWDVIVHQMRSRAYLTRSESQAIAEFLKEGTK